MVVGRTSGPLPDQLARRFGRPAQACEVCPFFVAGLIKMRHAVVEEWAQRSLEAVIEAQLRSIRRVGMILQKVCCRTTGRGLPTDVSKLMWHMVQRDQERQRLVANLAFAW